MFPPELQPYENVREDNYCVMKTFLAEKGAGRKWVVLPVTPHVTERVRMGSCDGVSELLNAAKGMQQPLPWVLLISSGKYGQAGEAFPKPLPVLKFSGESEE